MNNQLLSKLPVDIMIIISEYFTNIIYYKGKFININKIDKNDERYNLINSIKKPSVEVLSNQIIISYFLHNKNTNIGFHLQSSYHLQNPENTSYKFIKVRLGNFRGAYRKYLHENELKYNIIDN